MLDGCQLKVGGHYNFHDSLSTYFDSALACYVTQRPHSSTEDDSVVFGQYSNSIGNEKFCYENGSDSNLK